MFNEELVLFCGNNGLTNPEERFRWGPLRWMRREIGIRGIFSAPLVIESRAAAVLVQPQLLR
jgi:hypothetical protein